MFPLGDPPNYEPDPSTSVAATAATQGREPAAVAYDLMLADDGRGLLYMPVLNFADGTLDAVHGQLAHPASVAGLSDGGAHVGTICDVSFPTTLLQWWGRDRPHDRLPIELLVHKQTRATAETVGLLDRGLLAEGHRADINVIDFDALRLHKPEFALRPAGRRPPAAAARRRLRAHLRRRYGDPHRRRVDRRHTRPPRARRPVSVLRETDRARRGRSARPARRGGCGCGSAAGRTRNQG